MKLSFIVSVLFIARTSWFCIDVSALTLQQDKAIKHGPGLVLGVNQKFFHDDEAVEMKHGLEGGPMKLDDETADDNGGQGEVMVKHGEKGGLITKTTRAKMLGDLKIRRILQEQIEQIGMDIDGKSANEKFGRSVSMSNDGNRVAIASDTGFLRIYGLTGSQWTELGSEIQVSMSVTGYPVWVSMSADGTTVAIGAPSDSGGCVRVYKYSSDSWKIIGGVIDGEAPNGTFGYSVSMSSDGNKVVIGDYATNRVAIYGLTDSSSWEKLGSDIDGEAAGDAFGGSVSISSDGNRVAIGAPQHNGTAINSGRVRVFEYSSTSNTWNRMGNAIDGDANNDRSGNRVSISSNGKRVAIGAELGNKRGHVRVFEYSSTNNTWTKIGSDIDGENRGDYFGNSVSISNDGKRVAIGGYLNDDNGYQSGHVRVFDYFPNDNSWKKLGSDIDGEAAGDEFGGSVSMSSNGNRLAIGARLKGDTEIGHVRVFDLSTPTLPPTTPPTLAPTSSPTVSPFSWNIEALGNWTATFNEAKAGNQLEGRYKMTVGRKYAFDVLKPDCENPIGNGAIYYVPIPGDPIVPDTGEVTANIGISMNKLSGINDDNVYVENVDDGIDKIKICIKGSLLVPGKVETSVNFHETILSIFVDKTQDFIVEIDTDRTAATNRTDNVTVDYSVQPFICANGKLNNPDTWVRSDSDYSQGDVLKVCLNTTGAEDVYMEEVTQFQLQQESGGNEGISMMIGGGNEVLAGGVLAASECSEKLCMIQSMIPAKYFDDIDANSASPFDLKGEGEIVLRFGKKSRSRRLQSVLGDSSSTGASGMTMRSLQSGESAPASSFEVSVGLKGENVVVDDGREDSSAGRLPMFLSVVGTLLFTGVALVN